MTPDRLALRLYPGLAGCGEAEDASYTWALSPAGTHLTLTALDDACPDRAAVLSGEYLRDVCADPNAPCAGTLEAGPVFSTLFTPTADGKAMVGGLTFSVPEGWVNHQEQVHAYDLVPISEAGSDLSGAVAYNGIDVYARPSASEDDSCGFAEEPGIGTSMEDLVAWVTQHRGLDVQPPVTTTIGGRPATILDLVMQDTWTEGCPDFGITDPTIALLTEAGPGEGYAWGPGLGVDGKPVPQRLILVDIGDGQLVSVWIGARTAQEFDAFVEQAMPTVESFVFAD